MTEEKNIESVENTPARKAPQQGWLHRIATLLSWVMVPLLMPIFGIIFVFTLSTLRLTVMPLTAIVITLIITAINAVLPMILFYLLKVLGVIDDIGLNGRKERLIPYIITIFSFCLSAWYLLMHGAPDWVVMFFAGGALAALINMIVNFWWKISAHGAGAAGVVAVLAYIAGDVHTCASLAILIAWIALTGLLGASRIYLGRHTPMQVLAGYVVGYLSVALLQLIHF